jgi:tetratricopeptide (TPR) repeat protein
MKAHRACKGESMKSFVHSIVLLLALVAPLGAGAQTSSPAKGKPSPQPGKEMPVTTGSKEALALFQQGRDHFDNVEGALAAPFFAKAVQKDDRFALAHAYRALTGEGFEAARKHVDRAMELSGAASEGERLWIQGARARIYGDGAGVIASNDALLAMYPDDKRVQLLVGGYHQAVGDMPRAAPYFERAVALDPDFAPAQNSVGYARMALGDMVGAEKALRRYVDLRPDAPNPHDSLAEFLLRQGRFDESIASYRKALAVDPAYSSAWAGIGHGHVFRGRFAEARDAYAQGAAVAKDLNGKLLARFWRTVSYVHEGKTGEAVGSFDEMRAFADGNGAPFWAIWSHLHSAWILIEADAVGAAGGHLDAAIARTASSPLPPTAKAGVDVAIQRLRVMALGRIHAFEEARALAQKNAAAASALKDEGAQRWLASVQAWTELEAGNPDAALAHAQRGVRDNAWTLYQEAVARERKGEASTAQKGFAEVARWNQNDLGYALVRAKAQTRVGAAQ